MYNRNDKTYYIRHYTLELFYSALFVCGKPTLERKQIFFKIFCSPNKFEWNT